MKPTIFQFFCSRGEIHWFSMFIHQAPVSSLDFSESNRLILTGSWVGYGGAFFLNLISTNVQLTLPLIKLIQLSITNPLCYEKPPMLPFQPRSFFQDKSASLIDDRSGNVVLKCDNRSPITSVTFIPDSHNVREDIPSNQGFTFLAFL